jgi:hypothetical protein
MAGIGYGAIRKALGTVGAGRSGSSAVVQCRIPDLAVGAFGDGVTTRSGYSSILIVSESGQNQQSGKIKAVVRGLLAGNKRGYSEKCNQ